MYADIEDLVLSGKLFNNASGSSSPVRTPSPDAGWHDDEKLSDDDRDGGARSSSQAQAQQPHQSIGMGPGRTGVKGVIRDRDEASENDRSKRAKDVEEMNKRMERANLGGKTFLEEEREKKGDSELGEHAAKRDVLGRTKMGRFGHLREVGVHGFVDAVEREDRDVWVVVHLYDPSLERCYTIDNTLSRLARIHPDTKFLHARASALGFASTSSGSRRPPPSRIPNTNQDDDDDPYGDNYEKYHDEDEIEFADPHADVDTDMLPTMLVYRDGELVHNWVRVDWEAGSAGIEELLAKHRVLPQAFGTSVLLSDDEDEDDLDWTEE